MPFHSPRAAAALRRRLPLLILPTSLLLLGAAASSQVFPPREESRQQPALQDVLIRVLLQQDARLELGASRGPLQISDARGSLLLELAAGDDLRLAPGSSGLNLERRGASAAVLATGLREVWIAPPAYASADAVLVLGGKAFRGRLQVRLEAGQLQAINHVPLERYLASVVGSEMPASWPQAALQAQAVAARTYALARRRPGEPFDVRATVASQVYRGVDGEAASTREAVASTRGQVLLYNNAPIEAVFHSSSSSGRTESSGDLWTRQLPYLVSVPDFDNASPVQSWRARFEANQLRGLFPETGGVQRLDVINVSDSGRIRRVRIIGPRGAVVLTGAELRQRLGLRSTLVQMELLGGQPITSEPRPATGREPGSRAGTAVAGSGGVGSAGAGSAGALEVTSRQGSGAGASLGSATTGMGPAGQSAPPRSGAWGPLPPSLPPLPLAGGSLPRPIDARPDPPALVVMGKGFGHGVGLSQWGAYGMALQGRNYEQILLHYYRGVELKPYRASSF